MTESLVARGRVIAVHANNAVTVEYDRACPGCRCGRLFSSGGNRIELLPGSSRRYAIGRTLEIAAPAAELLRVSLWIYGLPWLALLLGTSLGATFGPGDAAAVIGAVAGLALGVFLLRLFARFVRAPRLEVRADE
jgi:positive regulator of sigma E activity